MKSERSIVCVLCGCLLLGAMASCTPDLNMEHVCNVPVRIPAPGFPAQPE